jgi:hypothetical protein
MAAVLAQRHDTLLNQTVGPKAKAALLPFSMGFPHVIVFSKTLKGSLPLCDVN